MQCGYAARVQVVHDALTLALSGLVGVDRSGGFQRVEVVAEGFWPGTELIGKVRFARQCVRVQQVEDRATYLGAEDRNR